MENEVMSADLSVMGMFASADIVVKVVMVGLALASVITWAILFIKAFQLIRYKKRLVSEQVQLRDVNTLDQAQEVAQGFIRYSFTRQLIGEAMNERMLSQNSADHKGIRERTNFRLDLHVVRAARELGHGNGYLATVGAIAPFIGLFGTVWGIMHSFIRIAQTQTTNLAVVAPGIAEALLATAIGLVAAIPAVVIYNLFSRMITGYKAVLGDIAAQILLLQSRDLDIAATRSAMKNAR